MLVGDIKPLRVSPIMMVVRSIRTLKNSFYLAVSHKFFKVSLWDTAI